MKFQSAILFTLAGSALAHDQCREVKKLMWEQDVANNDTKLQEVTKGNATEAAAFKDEASADAPKLADLQSNVTLMATCNHTFEVWAMRHECSKMVHMQWLRDMAANLTMAQNDSMEAAAMQDKVNAQADMLASLESNTTLTTFCANDKTESECHTMDKLKKMVDLANNKTALAAKFQNDTDKMAAFQAKAAKKEAKLSMLMSNSTLMDICSKLKAATNTTTSAASPNPTPHSGAVDVRPAGTMVSWVALVFAVVLLL